MEGGIGVPASQPHHPVFYHFREWEPQLRLSWSLPSLSSLHSPPLGLGSHHSKCRNITNQLSRIITSAVTFKKTSSHNFSGKEVFPHHLQLKQRALWFAIFNNLSALSRLWVPWNSRLALSHLCVPCIWYKINTQRFSFSWIWHQVNYILMAQLSVASPP